MRAFLVLALAFTAVLAAPNNPTRIVGGQTTTIDKYPEMVSILYDSSVRTFRHTGAGIILNNRAILTGAHIFFNRNTPEAFKFRAGSTFNNIGGQVLDTLRIIVHPEHQLWPVKNDIAIVHVFGEFNFNNVVRPAAISGPNYPLPDNAEVWAAGWGYTNPHGPSVTELHDVQMFTVNRDVCRERYTRIGYPITDDMICSGWLDVGGHDQCDEDFGGPLYHKGVVVGIFTIYQSCGHEFFPGVNMRVSSFTDWIISNA
ncbi:hypothetical protein ACJJTC_012727 [Scirpophaga incertulas]